MSHRNLLVVTAHHVARFGNRYLEYCQNLNNLSGMAADD
jgi:hypothetical protein